MRAQKGFLGDLLRLGGIAEHPERHAEDAVLIRPDELFERAIVAGPEPIEKAHGRGIIVSLHGKTITRGQSSRHLNHLYLMQQVDIYATRDRLTWSPRADQGLLFHEAILK
jgi:hypothetical protein